MTRVKERVGAEPQLTWPKRGEDADDLKIINALARELNEEAEDALRYQVPLLALLPSSLDAGPIEGEQ